MNTRESEALAVQSAPQIYLAALFQQFTSLFAQVRGFFLPQPYAGLAAQPGLHVRWGQAREQILTGLLRAAATLGLPVLAFAAQPVLELGLWGLLALYVAAIGVVWLFALHRGISYRMRGGALLLILYGLGVSELLNFGYTEDGYGYLMAFTIFALLLFGQRIGNGALIISTLTLGLAGAALSTQQFTPYSVQFKQLSPDVATVTTLLFFTLGAGMQVAIAALLKNVEEGWKQAHDALALLSREHDLLEQRVEERTRELAAAHEAALLSSRYKAEQNDFLSALHQTALELLSHHERLDLLQSLVERAATILDAPYGELMLREGDVLIVQARTASQAPLHQGRVGRDGAPTAWRAYDTQQPAIKNDYSSGADSRSLQGSGALRASADFPIISGERCLGVLSVGRTEAGRPFTPEDVQKGLLFSQMAAVVLDNAELYATALREIAERKQAEEALQRQAAMLQAHNADLDAFAHTVAHDLKNPLTTLIGNAELLQLTYSSLRAEEIERQLGLIYVAGQKMSNIISALLLLASVRAGVSVRRGPLAMGEIVAEVRGRLADMIERQGATVVEPESWPVALGYAPWVEEVWINYISNALKYGGRPPRITLGYEPPEGGMVRFWVEDNGAGLSAEQQARLFTPYTRLHTADIHGHGLGLSIVLRIVTELGGGVGIESAPGQGSRFFFSLPACDDGGAQEDRGA